MFIYLIKGILWVQSKNSLKYAKKKKNTKQKYSLNIEKLKQK